MIYLTDYEIKRTSILKKVQLNPFSWDPNKSKPYLTLRAPSVALSLSLSLSAMRTQRRASRYCRLRQTVRPTFFFCLSLLHKYEHMHSHKHENAHTPLITSYFFVLSKKVQQPLSLCRACCRHGCGAVGLWWRGQRLHGALRQPLFRGFQPSKS